MRGAKNSVLKLMAAALLAPGTSTLTNVPAIVDVEIMAELLRRLGCTVTWDTTAGVVEIKVPERLDHRADYDLVRRMRASICVLGPLVSRCGEADVAMPGGDNIGSRGLDLHIEGLRRMGVDVVNEHGYLVATSAQLTGADVWLDFPSVGATATRGDLSGLEGAGFTMVDGGAYDPDKAYKDSKLCNLLFVAEARKRYANAQVTVNAFSPGLIADPKGFFRNQNQLFATSFHTIYNHLHRDPLHRTT